MTHYSEYLMETKSANACEWKSCVPSVVFRTQKEENVSIDRHLGKATLSSMQCGLKNESALWPTWQTHLLIRGKFVGLTDLIENQVCRAFAAVTVPLNQHWYAIRNIIRKSNLCRFQFVTIAYVLRMRWGVVYSVQWSWLHVELGDWIGKNVIVFAAAGIDPAGSTNAGCD